MKDQYLWDEPKLTYCENCGMFTDRILTHDCITK